MKKNKYILIIVLALAVITLFLFLTHSKTTFKRALSDFAVDDTATITRIFMADKNNNTVKLIRLEPGRWMVNDKYPAQNQSINLLLKTMLDLEVKQPVAASAHNNIIKELAVSSVKVEIYQLKFRINFFGWMKCFPYEKLSKVYYVGGAIPSNLGSYMIMEHSTVPYVTFLPGFRGFVSPRYTPLEKNWRDYSVFKIGIPGIHSVRVEFPSDPDNAYEIKKEGEKQFSMKSLTGNDPVVNFDTLKVLNFLSGFRDLNFEALLNDMDPLIKDSVLKSPPFLIITLTDTSGQSRRMKAFHKANHGGHVDYEGKPLPYDPDRLYALVNDDQDFVLIQFFVFDKVLRPKFFFLTPEKKKGHPRG